MTAHELIYYSGTVCATLGAILAWTFVAIYARRRWFEYEMGKNAMLFTVVIAFALTWICYRAFLMPGVPEIKWQDNVVRLLIFAAITTALGHRLYITIKAGRARPKSPSKPSHFTKQIESEKEGK